MNDGMAVNTLSQRQVHEIENKKNIGNVQSFTEALSMEMNQNAAFDEALELVIYKNSHYVPGKDPMKFGIMQTTLKDYDPHGEIETDVRNLTPQKAKQIYRKIWERAGCGSLPEPLNIIHFESYVQRPRTADEALKLSKGNPSEYLRVRQALLQKLRHYPGYAKQWNDRIERLKLYLICDEAGNEDFTPKGIRPETTGNDAEKRDSSRVMGADDEVFAVAVKLLFRNEGGTLVSDDNGKGPSKFGILQTTLRDYDPEGKIAEHVEDLDEETARQVYRKIWERARCDELPYPLSVVHFDTYLHRPKTALEALVSSENNPVQYLAIRQTSLKSLKSYKKYGRGWENRIQNILRLIQGYDATEINKKV